MRRNGPDSWAISEGVVVSIGDRLPPSCPVLEVPQFDAEKRCLQAIQSGGDSMIEWTYYSLCRDPEVS